MAEQIDELESEIYELAGHEFTIGSPQQLADGPLRRARADQEAPRQDRLLDRRPRARPDPRRAPDRREGRALARADEAQEHLPRLAAGPDRPETGRIHTTFNQVDRRHRPALEHQPEPPEHPDPLRGRAAGPRAASSPSEGNRLLSADYNQVELRVLAHVAGEEVLREIFASGEDVHARDRRRGSRRRPRGDHAGRALEGEDGQLRHRLRALGLRARRPAQHRARGGGRPTSSATSSASRRSRRSSTRRSREARAARLRDAR